MSTDKSELRRELTAVRKRLSAEGNAARDAQILSHVLGSDAYQRAAVLLCYHATALEVSTEGLIRRALMDGKTVALPCCDPSSHTMSFYRYADFDALIPSHYGICEPMRIEENRMTDFTHAVCIVPALSVDDRGNRLGYGGGYYDRFLVENPALFTIGLCYSACCRESLPAQIHDIPLCARITENGYIDLTEKRNNLEENHAG